MHSGLLGQQHSASSAFVRLLHVICCETERFIVAHQMIVVVRDGENVRVYQEPHLPGVESREHLTDGRDPHLALVEHALFLGEEHAVGDCCVDIFVWVVVQADYVTLGDDVKKDGGKEGKNANDSTESCLQGKTLDSESSFQEYLWHEEETGCTSAVREHLHPCQKTRVTQPVLLPTTVHTSMST